MYSKSEVKVIFALAEQLGPWFRNNQKGILESPETHELRLQPKQNQGIKIQTLPRNLFPPNLFTTLQPPQQLPSIVFSSPHSHRDSIESSSPSYQSPNHFALAANQTREFVRNIIIALDSSSSQWLPVKSSASPSASPSVTWMERRPPRSARSSRTFMYICIVQTIFANDNTAFISASARRSG